MAFSHTRVGTAVFCFNRENGSFVIGRRKGSHGAGCLALPGGHLELNESFEECGAREILEETGLEVRGLKFLTCTNDIFEKEGKHYVTIFLGGWVDEGKEPQVLEPDKCQGWEWLKWEDLVRFGRDDETRLFVPLVNLFKQYEGFDPYKTMKSLEKK